MGNTQEGLAENSDQKIPVATIGRNGHTIQGSVKTKSERKLRGILRRIEEIVNQLNWTCAFKQERCLEALKQKKSELQVQVPSLKLSVQNVVDNINIITDKLSCIEIRLKDLHVGKSSTDTYDEARQQYFHFKSLYQLKLSEIQTLDDRILRQEPIVEKLKGHLEKLKKKEETYVEELASKELICKELSTAYDKIRSNFSTVYTLKSKYKSELAYAINAVQEATARIPYYEQQIAASQGNSYLSEDEIAHIAQEIESALINSKFKKIPLGPIEQYVAVRDERWLNAVSTYLTDILQCFCVDNSDDHKVLQSIFVKVLGTRPKPTMIQSEFFPSRHDVRAHEVRPPQGMCSMLDMLTIENPVIVNCLIDQMEVERMLLVPTNEEAHQLMSNADTVPINIKAAITPRGTQFYPSNVRISSLADDYVAMQENEAELESWQQYKLTSEQEVTQLTKSIQEKSAELAKIDAERLSAGEALLDAQANVREHKNFNSTISWKPSEADYQEELATLNSFKNSKEELVTECHVVVDALIEAKKVVTALRETVHLFGDKDSFLFDRKMLRNQLRVLKTKKKRFSILLSNVQSEIVSVTSSILLQQQVSDQANRLIRRGYRYRHPKTNSSKEKKTEKLLEEKRALEEIILTSKKQQH